MQTPPPLISKILICISFAGAPANYILFTEKFIKDILSLKNMQQQFLFLDFDGIPFFILQTAKQQKLKINF